MGMLVSKFAVESLVETLAESDEFSMIINNKDGLSEEHSGVCELFDRAVDRIKSDGFDIDIDEEHNGIVLKSDTNSVSITVVLKNV